MGISDPEPTIGRWRAARFALFIAAAAILVGTTVSIGAGLWQVLAQDYLSLHYYRLSFLLLRDTMNCGLVTALLIGVGLALVALAVSRWHSAERVERWCRSVGDFDERGKWSLLCAGGAVAGVLSGAHTRLAYLVPGFTEGSLGAKTAAIVVLAIGSMAAAAVTYALWRRPLTRDHPEGVFGVMLAVWITVGGTMWIATWANEAYLPGILYPKSIAANLGFAAALLVFVGPTYWLRAPVRKAIDWGGRKGKLSLQVQFFALLASIAILCLNLPIFAMRNLTGPPNLLLISVDTLRADHLSCYGYHRMTSPQMDELARAGIRFENAVAASTWTLSSHATMLTGLFPSTHRALQPDDKIDQAITLISETLRQEGYRTGAVVSGLFVSSWFNFHHGFEYFDEANVQHSEKRVSSPSVTDAALRWLAEVDEEPFFLFVHYFDPHSSYLYHPEFDYYSEYEGAIRGGEPFAELRDSRDGFSSDDVRKLVALYDGEINITDRAIGRLLNEIEKMGLAGNLLTVLTSDHGEEFMEHGWLGHRINLYEPAIHVPLIMTWPRRIAPGQVVKVPVSQTDLAPTLLEAAGIEAPSWCQTQSLWELLNINIHSISNPAAVEGTTEADQDRTVFTEVSFTPGPGSELKKQAYKTGTRTQGWKFIHDEMNSIDEIYNLAADPLEASNLSEATPEMLPELTEAWRDLCEEAGRIPYSSAEKPTRRLSEKEIERLKSLGYF
jgi:arylsulfatase A-like enzyme